MRRDIKRTKATLAGLFFLALATLLVAWLIPPEQVPHLMWFFVYLMLAATALFAWRHSEAPSTSRGWLSLAAAAAVFGALLTAVESVFFGPKSAWVLLDVVFAAGSVLVACSGAVYAAAKQQES